MISSAANTIGWRKNPTDVKESNNILKTAQIKAGEKNVKNSGIGALALTGLRISEATLGLITGLVAGCAIGIPIGISYTEKLSNILKIVDKKGDYVATFLIRRQ